jgi:hypothetical protein
MYCPTCGNEIPVELKYCNRCGANLSTVPETFLAPPAKPVKITIPVIVLGFTVILGIGLIFNTASELAMRQMNPVAIVWMVIFGLATLFGCTALMLRFFLKVLAMNRESYQPQNQIRPPVQMPVQMPAARPALQPRLEPAPSVTEHTTRTFSQVYRDVPDPDAR